MIDCSLMPSQFSIHARMLSSNLYIIASLKSSMWPMKLCPNTKHSYFLDKLCEYGNVHSINSRLKNKSCQYQFLEVDTRIEFSNHMKLFTHIKLCASVGLIIYDPMEKVYKKATCFIKHSDQWLIFALACCFGGWTTFLACAWSPLSSYD